jgi:predicted ArsR family transcriptional regulator
MTTSDPVETISLLGEPVRRRLYDYAVHEPEPVSREQAAKAVGTKRSLAAFHLDKLAQEGLLDVEFKRLSGRKGPGAGRPAKLYKKPAQDLEVSLPHREYRLAATLFAQALSSKQSSGDVVKEVARAFGRELAHEVKERAAPHRGRKNLIRTASDVLREHGYQPFHDPDGAIRLRNCPFHSLSRDFRDLVCGMNLEIMQSLLEELGLERLEACLEPQAGTCCVAFRRA